MDVRAETLKKEEDPGYNLRKRTKVGDALIEIARTGHYLAGFNPEEWKKENARGVGSGVLDVRILFGRN